MESVRKISTSSQKSNAETLVDFQVLIDYANSGIELRQAKRQKLDVEYNDGILEADKALEKHKMNNEKMSTLYEAILQLERQKYRLEKPNLNFEPDRMAAAFTDSILKHIYVDPTTPRKKNSAQQSSMRAESIKVYDARDPNNKDNLFCCVTGEYADRQLVVAAHIVPAAFPPTLVSHICGPSLGERLYSWDNALLMHKGIEQAMDNGDIVIVPHDLKESPITTFEVKLVNQAARKSGYPYTKDGVYARSELHHLDGKILTFLNDKRPLKRFLYFRYLLTVLYNKTHPRFDNKSTLLQLRSNNPWPTIKGYLKNSFLLRFAQEVGDADPEKISEIYESLGGENDEESDERSQSRIVFGRTLQNIKEMANKDDEDEDENDEDENENEEGEEIVVKEEAETTAQEWSERLMSSEGDI